MVEMIPFRDRLSATVNETCSATGLSRSALYAAMTDGRVSFVQHGRRRLILVESVTHFLEPVSHQRMPAPAELERSVA
jgi:excisionase family DNA binding protein